MKGATFVLAAGVLVWIATGVDVLGFLAGTVAALAIVRYGRGPRRRRAHRARLREVGTPPAWKRPKE